MIILSVRGDEEDRLLGLEVGAALVPMAAVSAAVASYVNWMVISQHDSTVIRGPGLSTVLAVALSIVLRRRVASGSRELTEALRGLADGPYAGPPALAASGRSWSARVGPPTAGRALPQPMGAEASRTTICHGSSRSVGGGSPSEAPLTPETWTGHRPRVIESHAGSISVANVNGGCRFDVELPTQALPDQAKHEHTPS